MGWVFPFAFAGLAMLAFWLWRPKSRLALEILAAAVLIAIAGYAWQGSPDMPGHPVTPAGVPG
jgi:cytochrome c-type biogenesis protein CcmH